MITTVVNTLTILEADEGKYLTNGETYSTKVYLGKNDSVDNWHEVDSINEETELTDSEALSIILGGNDV